MRLLQRIGKIFDPNLRDSLRRFRVKDSGIDRCELRVVLLVESPHTAEVSPPDEKNPHKIGNRYPLAGESGTTVSNKFMEWYPKLSGRLNEPIGKLVHNDNPNVNWLGIMNASQLPFQENVYQIPDGAICRKHPKWDDYRSYMNIIREGPCRNGRSEVKCKELDDAIAEDLRGRLEFLHGNHPGVLLVRCGEVAKAFYAKAIEMNVYLPHPARQNWQNLNPQQNACLQEIRRRI